MATSTPPSVEESLAEPTRPKLGSRLAKNLHIIIPSILVSMLAIVLFSGAAERDQQAAPQSLAEKAAGEINDTAQLGQSGEEDDIQKELNRQRAMPLPAASENMPALPPVPSSYGGAVPPTPGLPQAMPARPDGGPDVAAAEKREADIRASPLLALTGSGKGRADSSTGGAPTSGNAAIADLKRKAEEQTTKARQMQEEMLRTLKTGAGGTAAARGAVRSAATGGDDNSAWLANLDAAGGTPRDVITLEATGPKPVLHQGVIIPAVLITEMNSDLPGQLSAMVTMDVYDSIRGDHKLIPKGSRLVGAYNNAVAPGQERVMAAFTRLVRPDGSSIDLRAMSAADAAGQSGLTDEVDNHFFKMFSTSFLVAGIAYLFEQNQPDTVVVTGGGTAQGLSSEAGKVLADVSRTVLDRYKVIPPTLIIRKGHKFNVVVNRDISIPAYD